MAKTAVWILIRNTNTHQFPTTYFEANAEFVPVRVQEHQ